MKEITDYQQDITSIRSIMERSAKFISLSGLSGIMAGVYAIIGAGYAYYLIYYPSLPIGFRVGPQGEQLVVWQLIGLAAVVLVLSLGSAVYLSIRKASRAGVSVWNKTSQLLLINLLIPLGAGGLFTLIVVSLGYYAIVPSSCLIFYGLALVSAGQFTLNEVRYLGFLEIGLGLFSMLFPGYGLIFWTVGFGLLHIIYGTVMYFRYEQ